MLQLGGVFLSWWRAKNVGEDIVEGGIWTSKPKTLPKEEKKKKKKGDLQEGISMLVWFEELGIIVLAL